MLVLSSTFHPLHSFGLEEQRRDHPYGEHRITDVSSTELNTLSFRVKDGATSGALHDID